MAQSLELQSKLAIWRQKAIDGTITQDELKEAVIAMRGERVSAHSASDTARRKRTIMAVPSAEDLLAELDGLGGV